jgi:peptidoglycan/xylan/chitin deacetylase (PgdA/CDA1 family)
LKASIKAKSVLASLLYSAGISLWKLRRYLDHDFAVLMYHRVIPRKEASRTVQAGMVVEPETLALHIRFLRKYFEIIPLSDLASFQKVHPQKLRKNRLCALTFDDGWYDFYEYAYPILKLHEAPATVFLPTDFIGTDRWFWTDRLGFLLDRTANSWDLVKRVPVFRSPLVNLMVHMSGTPETRLEKAIALLKYYRIEEIEQVLLELTAVLGEDSTPPERAFLSWEEVQEMAGSGFISFGSHTAGHRILTTLTEEEAAHELRKSMDVLISQEVVDSAFIPFSYPNGNFTDRLSEMVRETGYHLAVTTQYGWNRWGKSPYTLRRIAIHQDMASTEAMLGSRIVNLI